MKIGLVSYRCENRNTAFNMKQIELAMQRAKGKTDLLSFGELLQQDRGCLYRIKGARK